MAQTERKCEDIFKGVGFLKVELVNDPSFGVFDFGNVSAITQNVTFETDAVRDSQTGVGNCASFEDITEVTIDIAFYNLRNQLLAWANRAGITNEPAGAHSDEPHSVFAGGLLQPNYLIDKSVVPALTGPGGTPALVENTDWCFTNGNNIKILSASPNVVDPPSVGDVNIELDYTGLATDVLEYFINSGELLRFYFEGKNRNGNRPFNMTAWRGRFRLVTGFPWISQTAANPTLTVELFPESSRDGVALSQYMTVQRQAEAA